MGVRSHEATLPPVDFVDINETAGSSALCPKAWLRNLRIALVQQSTILMQADFSTKVILGNWAQVELENRTCVILLCFNQSLGWLLCLGL